MGKLVPDIILRRKTSGPVFQFSKFSHILLKLIKSVFQDSKLLQTGIIILKK